MKVTWNEGKLRGSSPRLALLHPIKGLFCFLLSGKRYQLKTRSTGCLCVVVSRESLELPQFVVVGITSDYLVSRTKQYEFPLSIFFAATIIMSFTDMVTVFELICDKPYITLSDTVTYTLSTFLGLHSITSITPPGIRIKREDSPPDCSLSLC